jgi:hypothetical protein
MTRSRSMTLRSRGPVLRWFAALAIMVFSVAYVDCADRAASDPMPAMLRGVRLGMAEQEFRAARPSAETFVILDEPESARNDPNPLYVESFSGSPFFDSAMYLFCERRLCAVTLSAVGRGEGFADRQARVLQGALRKWGSQPERLLNLRAQGFDPAEHMTLESSKVEPRKRGVLLWKTGGIDVLVTFAPLERPPGRARVRPGEIGVTLTDPQLLSVDLRRNFFDALVPAQSEHDANLFALLDREAEPPLFE